jgi:hypothetical protein
MHPPSASPSEKKNEQHKVSLDYCLRPDTTRANV